MLLAEHLGGTSFCIVRWLWFLRQHAFLFVVFSIRAECIHVAKYAILKWHYTAYSSTMP